MTTVLEVIDGGTRYLEKRGIDDARRNMQYLVAHHLNCTRMELYTRFDQPLEESALAPIRNSLKRRGEGEPLQHLLGTVVFHGRTFRSDRRALIPRPETEELAEMCLKLDLPPNARVLDVGCGSGVLGLTLAAERPGWQVTLADISIEALQLAQENAESLGIDVAWCYTDLFSNIAGRYDLIVANLPYVPDGERATVAKEVTFDPELALYSGADGLDLIRRMIPESKAHLNPGGWVALEIGHDQASQVAELFEDCAFQDVRTEIDLSGIARFPFARLP